MKKLNIAVVTGHKLFINLSEDEKSVISCYASSFLYKVDAFISTGWTSYCYDYAGRHFQLKKYYEV